MAKAKKKVAYEGMETPKMKKMEKEMMPKKKTVKKGK